MTEQEKRTYVQWALHQRRGDDLERANMAFGKMTEAQLDQEWGQCGQTCRAVWNNYKDQAAKHDEVCAWLTQKGVL
jgi:hypothetical protein